MSTETWRARFTFAELDPADGGLAQVVCGRCGDPATLIDRGDSLDGVLGVIAAVDQHWYDCPERDA